MHGIDMFNRNFRRPLNKATAILPLIAAGLFLMLPLNAAAQEVTAPAPAPDAAEKEATRHIVKSPYDNYLSLSYENDLIGDGKDRYYTSGVRATYYNVNSTVPPIIDELADAVPEFKLNATTSTFFSLGQNLYTPSSIIETTPDPDDRPYAAWLYGSVGLATLTKDHIDQLEITLGVVGPEALGKQTQTFIHKHITDSPKPQGWSHQIGFEPGVILSWERRWPRGFHNAWTLDFGNDLRLNAEPNVNVSLGNVYTYAGTGVMLTFGPHQDVLQDTPPRVRPAMSGTGYFDVPENDWSWYLFTGADARLMARNIFLDGNTFKDSPSVDKKLLVGDAVAGVAFTFHDYRLSYTANYRTKEFDGQDKDSIFGSLTLTTRF